MNRHLCYPIALGTLITASAMLVVNCGGTKGSNTRSPTDFNSETIPSDTLDKFGCDIPDDDDNDGGIPHKRGDPYTVCVNACTGRLLEPNVTPVAEGQQVAIRLVGWEACRPTKAMCSTHLVDNIDIGIRQPVATPPQDAGTSAPKATAVEPASNAQASLSSVESPVGSAPLPSAAPANLQPLDAASPATAPDQTATDKLIMLLDKMAKQLPSKPNISNIKVLQANVISPMFSQQDHITSGVH